MGAGMIHDGLRAHLTQNGRFHVDHFGQEFDGGVMVVDNFLSDPAQVRASALQSGFGTWRPNKGEVGSSVYTGINFWGSHAVILKSLARAVGQPVYPNSMFFRVCNLDTEGAYIHSDREAGDYTCIVYLSEHETGDSGTGFFRHKATNRTRMQSFAEMALDPGSFAMLKNDMVSGSVEAWDLTKFVVGHYNRALIFEAPLFHSRVPKHGFGVSDEDGRMVWACHFKV